MSTNVQQQDQVVASAIREISHIATLPEITMKIVELVENPKSTAQDLHKVINNDPALCTRILKVVNSSFYGLPGQIGSINRAIVMLGLNAVKNIAIAASLAKLFRGGEVCPGFAAQALWEHSVATATAMKMIADKLKIGIADEAFLAGLMHDIGVMVELQFDRNKLTKVVALTGPGPDGTPANSMIEMETSVFAADHTAFGHGLCEKWKFPASFATVCRFHHDPLKAPPEQRTLPGMAYVADRLAGELKGAYRMDLVDLAISSDVLDAIRLSSEALADIRAQLPNHIQNSAGVLG